MDDLTRARLTAAAGMAAQGARLRVIAENMANVDSTAAEKGGDPFRRKVAVFKNELDRELGTRQVTVDKIVPDRSDFIRRYEPNHPAADDKGYVNYPNVNPIIELMDMREAQRSYEANLNVFKGVRQMSRDTLELLRN
ncbi:MAG: flagellar basal body rod protein FlgC [Alphaproteobacteria bacterium]|nr:flagellar basal body rod protein FlgC [Alphaproteobacteria bacterium]